MNPRPWHLMAVCSSECPFSYELLPKRLRATHVRRTLAATPGARGGTSETARVCLAQMYAMASMSVGYVSLKRVTHGTLAHNLSKHEIGQTANQIVHCNFVTGFLVFVSLDTQRNMFHTHPGHTREVQFETPADTRMRLRVPCGPSRDSPLR